MPIPRELSVLTLSLVLGAPAAGQSLVWTYDHPQGYGHYEAAGDVDGDGVPDLLTGTPGFTSGAQTVGVARLHSGADGGLIRERVGQAPGEAMGSAVCAAGDVDGDGSADVWIGHFGVSGYELLLWSGATGAVLDVWPAPPGTTVHEVFVVGDVDADGSADLALVLGDGCAPSAGRLVILSGADKSELATHCNPAEGYAWHAAEPAGDVDGDGVVDLLVRRDDATGGEGVDAVSVLSGADLSTIHDIVHGGPVTAAFGSSLAGGHDIDGDGVPDFVIGARQDDHGGAWMGAVYVHSGADASLIRVIDGNQFYEQFGALVALPGDLDGDGLADVVVDADGYALDGDVVEGLLVFRSSDWSVVRVVPQGLAGTSWPRLVSAGDVDGDGAPELLTLGRPSYAPPVQSSELWLVAGRPLVAPSVGGSLEGLAGLPRLRVEGSLHNETPLTIGAQHFLPHVPAAVVIGYAAVELPFKGGTLVPSPDAVVAGLPTDAEGALAFTVQMPITLPPGFEVYVQVWAPDVGAVAGFAATDAARLAIDP